jgi:hypothetical protein
MAFALMVPNPGDMLPPLIGPRGWNGCLSLIREEMRQQWSLAEESAIWLKDGDDEQGKNQGMDRSLLRAQEHLIELMAAGRR